MRHRQWVQINPNPADRYACGGATKAQPMPLQQPFNLLYTYIKQYLLI